jgi:hypothetical protein
MEFTKYQTITLLSATLLLGTAGCSKLDDTVLGKLSSETANSTSVPIDPASSLQGAISALNALANGQGGAYAMEEHPTDEMQGPTRGTDWDDFGTWRKLHQHTWTPEHVEINNAWDNLNSGAFKATQTISVAGSDAAIKAQAQFLRAFFMFYVVDLYGQVPVREATDAADANPKVLDRSAATDYIIADLTAAIPNLPTVTAATNNRGSKEAAQFLLAKLLLNKAVYKQPAASPAGPFTFAKADMDAVIAACNTVIASGKFSLQPKGSYFDNFTPNNSTASKENIYVIANDNSSQPGNVRNRYYMTLHYNQQPSSWNGFTTLADFYNSFDKADERLGKAVTGITDSIGVRAGFLVGQQFDKKGAALKDRSGNPLIFTPDVNLSYALEAKGIRVVKYLPQPGFLDNPANDYVFFRYADLLLMKAEAILRGGTDPSGQTAEQIVNNLRTTRGVAAKTPIDAKAILAERGFELYWEGWRRNDQIRFGTFLDPVDNRPSKSADTKVLFPIPQRAVDSNPNLKQNPGY